MIKPARHCATIAAMLLAVSYVALPQAQAAGEYGAGMHPFQPFQMQMTMTPKEMKVIHADIDRMHTLSCTLKPKNATGNIVIFSCTPGH